MRLGLPPQRLLFGLRNPGAVYQAALSKIQHQRELPELEYYSDSDEEKPLIRPALGLVITSTLEGRFVYWADQKPFDLATDDDSCLIACIEQLPYQEGTPLPTISEEGDTKIITSSSGSSSPSRQLYAVLTEQEAGQPSRDPHTPEHFPNDVSADELTADMVPPETEAQKAARRLRNTKRAERRQHLKVNLPIRNLTTLWLSSPNIRTTHQRPTSPPSTS